MSRRRQHQVDWRSGHAPHLVPPGYGERHVRTAWFGTGEIRLCSLVSKDHSYKPMVKEKSSRPVDEKFVGLRGDLVLTRF